MFIIAILFVATMISTPAQAVQTVYVEHNSEKQFKDGDPNGVIINSEGEIYLANETETLLKDPNGQWAFNALALDNNGVLYAATSGKGHIYRFKDGHQNIIYSGPDGEQTHIFSLAIDNQGQLLAGVCAKAGTLLRFDENGKSKILWTDPQVKYIWDIVVGPAGRIYLATGPTGKVITLEATGTNPQLLYKSREKNILSLALGRDGLIYAGGDEFGLVYKIDPGNQKTTVLYDTDHREISGLVFDEKGNLYVSTGDSDIRMTPGSRLVLANGDISRSEASANKNNRNKASARSSARPNAVKKTAETPDEGEGDDEGDNGNDDTELIPAATKEPGPELPKMPLFPDEGLLKKPTSVNEVYKIDTDGYASTIFSKAVVILTMVYSGDGKLLLGTGNQGHLLKLDIETQEAEILHTAKPSLQIASLLIRNDATIFAGCANPAALMAIKPTYRQTGNYVSPVIDAAQPSQWGKIQIKADIPAGASLAISSRSGNTGEPDHGGWQGWTDSRQVSEDLPILSAVGRFLQYRLELSSTQGSAGAIVKSVKLAHLVPNLPPKVQSVKVTRTEKAEPGHNGPNSSVETEIPKTMQVTWRCSDDNNDKLIYNVYIRPQGTDRWVRIAKEIKETEYKWDSQTIADGHYELKVEASDKPANPAGTQLTDSRVSKIIVVDNTPPGVDEVNYHLTDNILSYNASLSDELSVITAIDYILDSRQQWQPGLPVDGVFDSRSEKVKFECEITDPGEHLLAVRFTDAMGNKSYRNFTVIVPDKTVSSDKEKNVGKQENQQN
jgi:hypothetical protein